MSSGEAPATPGGTLHTAGGLASHEHVSTYKYLPKISEWTNSDLVLQFLHAIIDDMCGKEQSYVKRFQNCGSADSILGSVKAYRLFFQSAISYDLSNEQLAEDLELCGLPQNFVAPIVSVLRSRVDELATALRSQASRISGAVLADFDWKLNITMASSKLAAFKDPKLLLSMQIEDADGEATEKTVELSRADLDRLIQTLETVQGAVQSLQA
eukprot:a175649_316.p1 GENE.a175649_316~~a175649_316.p1  ORF type:complete len:222 (-),score=65.65 a175649_316:29-664(-)